MKHAYLKLWKSKKGFNDMYMLFILILILFGSALVIPTLSSAAGESYANYNRDNITSEVKDKSQSTTTSTFGVIGTLFKLGFWDFGDTLHLPAWLDLFYSMLTLIILVILARNIWIGGGG